MNKTSSVTHKRGKHSTKKKNVKKSKRVARQNNSTKEIKKASKSGKKKSSKSGKGKSSKSGKRNSGKSGKRNSGKSSKKKSSKSGKKNSGKSGKRNSGKSGKRNSGKSGKKKDLIRLYGGSSRCGSNHVLVPGITINSSMASVEPLYLEDQMALLGKREVIKKVDHARHN